MNKFFRINVILLFIISILLFNFEAFSKTKMQKSFLKDTWTWTGIGFTYSPTSMNRYITKPIIDYQLGIATSFWHGLYSNTLYATFIADLAYSQHNFSNGYAVYAASNIAALLGYEQIIRSTKKHLSYFFELGPSIGQRSFNLNTNSCSSSDIGYVFNVFGNFGLNYNFNPFHDVSYGLRLAMGWMWGPNANLTSCNGKNNLNPFTIYAPSIGFQIKW